VHHISLIYPDQMLLSIQTQTITFFFVYRNRLVLVKHYYRWFILLHYRRFTSPPQLNSRRQGWKVAHLGSGKRKHTIRKHEGRASGVASALRLSIYQTSSKANIIGQFAQATQESFITMMTMMIFTIPHTSTPVILQSIQQHFTAH
jgi:hypothetical protein